MKNLRVKEILIALLLATFLVACGSDKKDNVTIGISPMSATPNVGTPQPFTVTITGSTNTGYSVSATPAGSGCPSGVQSDGMFSCTPTSVGTYTITVTSSADTTKTSSATLTASAPFSEAPPTTPAQNCSDPIGTGTNRVRIAVASNFNLPAQDLARNWFQASSYGDNTSVIVCHNSTGTLRNEINGGYDGYAMLFTADPTAQNYDNQYGTVSYVYARGVPLLAAQRSVISDVSGLIASQSGTPALSGLTANIEEGPTELRAKYRVNTTSAQMVSVADPNQAPYGEAAELIFDPMMNIAVRTAPPSWVFTGGNVPSNGLWNNIDNTLLAVTNNTVAGLDTSSVKSGLIAKSSICGEIAPNATDPAWTYVEFTNPVFIRNQKAILLDTGNSAAVSLNNYIQNAMTTGVWGDFLAGNCYLPLE